MENQQQNIRSWDDLIFENRNKAYGAYAIRQDYSTAVIKGVFTSIGIIIAVLIVSGFNNAGKIIEDIPPLDRVFELKPQPKVLADVVPIRQREPVRRTNPVLPPVATTDPDPVEPDKDPVQPTSGTAGSPEGTVTTDTGTSTGGTDNGSPLGNPVSTNEPYTHVEVMPVYKTGYEGMIKVLRKNMRYPNSAKQMGKEGTVYVEFVVSDEGEIGSVKVIRGFDKDCDKEAMRIVEKLTEWIPGSQNKMTVNVKLVLPIRFQLER